MLDDDLADYHFGEQHPFGPKRYWAFKEECQRRKLDENSCVHSGQLATVEQLALFHSADYIKKVQTLSKTGKGYLDGGDTPALPGIFESASIMVGSSLKAVDHIMQGDCTHAFSPIAGLHHATRESAAGFCVFNDCGVVIEHLRKTYGIQRIAYIDIDAHHGDGVFYSFESDKDLIFIDLHQDGRTLYPGTGAITETGKDDAIGTKLNIPLQPRCTDEIAKPLWETAEKFLIKAQPEFILLQCGADSLAGDPITQLELSADFHGHVAKRLVILAEQLCGGRLFAMGGGGYNLNNIKMAWNNVLEAMVDVD